MDIETKSDRKSSTQGQQGIALIAALFVLLILTLLGLAMLMTSATEVMISNNYRSSKAAFYSAEAGTEEARLRLGSTFSGTLAGLLSDESQADTRVVYIISNASIDPTNNSSSNPY